MSDWFPGATRVLGRSAGSHTGGGSKITLHTTEGSSAAGAIAAYRGHGGWPHFTVEWTGSRLKVFQHLPLSQAARALAHPSGPETNRASTIQIEQVGFAARTEDWSDAHYEAIGELCEWIGRQTGCPMRPTEGTRWGVDRPPRLSGSEFFSRNGINGHQHVPGNEHWDPGEYRIDKLIDFDNSADRNLREGDSGSDVRALQVAINKRARGCHRKDRMVKVDGIYGPKTAKNAAWAAYILGVGTSQGKLLRGGLSAYVQRMVRYPDRRNSIQKARAGGRRRKYCKKG